MRAVPPILAVRPGSAGTGSTASEAVSGLLDLNRMGRQAFSFAGKGPLAFRPWPASLLFGVVFAYLGSMACCHV
jgi:hypothetical protein